MDRGNNPERIWVPFAIKYRIRIPTLWPLIWLSLINYLIQKRLLSLHTQLVHGKIRASSIPNNSFLQTPMCQCPSSPPIHPESHLKRLCTGRHQEHILLLKAQVHTVCKSARESPSGRHSRLFTQHTVHCFQRRTVRLRLESRQESPQVLNCQSLTWFFVLYLKQVWLK